MIRFSDNIDSSKIDKVEKNSEIRPSNSMTDKDVNLFWKSEFQKVRDAMNVDNYDVQLSDVFNCSEDEIGVEFNIDDSIISTLEQFSNEKWDKLDDKERLSVIFKLVEQIAERLDIKDVPKISIYDSEGNSYGYYNPIDNTINLNKFYFNYPYELINTVAHEMRHAYQEQRAGILETKEDALFKLNLDNYISPVPLPGGGWLFFTDYQDQYVEADARAFANLFTEAMKYE